MKLTFLNAGILGVILGMAACGPAEDGLESFTDEIVGGRRAQQGEFPWMAALGYKRGNGSMSQWCGGTLIRSDWVITAAHCVEGESAGDLAVGLGNIRISRLNRNQISGVERIHMHPNYNSRTTNNDIALLELSKSFDNLETVNMITSNQESQFADPGALATAIGWGLRRENANSSPNALRKVNVPIVSRAECNDQYDGDITNRMICAGRPQGGKDACQGDSGGPLVVQGANGPILAGITSWGNGCARAGFAGVYSRVAALRGWARRCINQGNCN